MKIKAECLSLQYVGKGQVCVCVCALSKEGITSPITLLCSLSSLQAMKQELMQNQFSVLLIFFFFFKDCLSQQFSSFFSWGNHGDFLAQDV